MELHELSAADIRNEVTSREVSAVDVAKAALARVAALDPKIKAFMHVNEALVLEVAKAVDEKIAAGNEAGKLAGVPVAVKDNMCTIGQPTTCSSKILQNFMPPYDAHVVERLRAEDAVIIGKTNLDEFAMGSSTENSGFFTTRNPWNLDRVPGGSSGGSAAAVAAGIVPLSIGSDTGGSIRQPAGFCSVYGMKPTYGRVSRYGLVAFASSLDQIGPFARNIVDTALLLEVLSKPDKRDSTCADLDVPPYCAEIEQAPEGLKIGIPKEYFGEGIEPDVEAAVCAAMEVYRDAGVELIDISLPHTEYAVATYYIVATAEASSNLARYDGVHYGHRSEQAGDIIEMYSASRAEGFGDEVKRRIMLGTFALSSGYYDAYYLRASKVRNLIKMDFDAAFEKVDCILCPTSPTEPFKIGDRTDDPLQMYLSDVLTIPTNLAGLPGISIPCGFTKGGLPVGMQILGKQFDETTILRAAKVFEDRTDHHKKRPEIM
ncbi:MAG: Asp-tRNA(Asn)/Glu-tRNA(Gln) amidotransferase subunit GatA [Planctomycetes bacterium]|nr:Asp-tRNA(Asn)/Glu-tRNA(Gln) amidotransferase subunit GatA [Planctomycetota bacterium]